MRLVVGTINLVEKIAQLARIPMQDVDKLARNDRAKFEKRVLRESLELDDRLSSSFATTQPLIAKPKQIVKEGLSEYFIYTIEGTETIRNGWSKRLRSFEAAEVPLAIQYRYRPAEYGNQLVRMYLLTNDKASKLGTTPLPDGMVRVYRDNGRDGLSFLAAQRIKYIPIGDKIELNLGQDPNVIFELVKLRTFRDNIWLKLRNANVFRRVGDGQGQGQIQINSTVAGWDSHEIYSQRIRNYTPKPIELEIRRGFAGQIIFRSQLEPTLYDFRTVQFTATVDAEKKADLLFEVLHHQGRNATQNSVTLEAAPVRP